LTRLGETLSFHFLLVGISLLCYVGRVVLLPLAISEEADLHALYYGWYCTNACTKVLDLPLQTREALFVFFFFLFLPSLCFFLVLLLFHL
jgi:hypothetical protein